LLAGGPPPREPHQPPPPAPAEERVTSSTRAITSSHGVAGRTGGRWTPKRSRASVAMSAGSPRRSSTVRTPASVSGRARPGRRRCARRPRRAAPGGGWPAGGLTPGRVRELYGGRGSAGGHLGLRCLVCRGMRREQLRGHLDLLLLSVLAD